MARKQIQLPVSARAKAKEFAELNQLSLSELIREWIEDYEQNGTDYKPEATQKCEVNPIDPEVLARAESRAAEEGTTLRDVVLHQITQLDDLVIPSR